VRDNLVEGRRAALDAVDLVALGQEELRQVASVLPGDSCHEGDLTRHRGLRLTDDAQVEVQEWSSTNLYYRN